MNEVQVKTEIRAYIDASGTAYSRWYVGIAADPRSRLTNDHHVPGVEEGKGSWCYRDAESDAAARRIEKWFIDVLGTDGGTGGGDWRTTSVYAYLMIPRQTDP